MKLIVLTLALSLLISVANAATPTATACDIGSDPSGQGFSAVFYSFPTGTQEALLDSIAYNAYEYKSQSVIGRASGISNTSVYWEPSNLPPADGSSDTVTVSVYGVKVPLTHFSVELTGYFKAPETGVYTFGEYTDNYSSMGEFLGTDAFDCCNTNELTNGTDYFLQKLVPDDTETNGGSYATIQLSEGEYYPLRIVYTNYVAWTIIKLNFTTPSGTTYQDDWEQFIYQFPNTDEGGVCETATVTTTIPWTGVGTTTIIETSGSTVYDIIETPETTVDTTSTWTGTGTYTTFFTSNSTPYSELVVPSTGPSTIDTTSTWTGTGTYTTLFTSNSTPYSELVVPSSGPSTIDTTSTWTGTGTYTTFFTSSGTPYSELVVPSSGPSTVDTTSFWTGTDTYTTLFTSNSTPYSELVVPSTEPSTVDTSSTSTGTSTEPSTVDTTSFWTGTDTYTTLFTSNSTPYSEIVVPSTSPSTVDTTSTSTGTSTEPSTVDTTSYWTGTGTYTTFFTSSGTPYSELVVPSTEPSTVDTTSFWTGTDTYTTFFTSNGTPYSELVVPSGPSTIDTTIPWTGSTDSVTTFTSNGTPYVEHLTPYPTTTLPWSGSNTITTVIPNPTGPGSIYEVLTPTSGPLTTTITVYEPCTSQVGYTSTETNGATVVVVIGNSQITAVTTVTDSNPVAVETSLSNGGTPASPATVSAFEGGAKSLKPWALAVAYPLLILVLVI